MFLVFAEDEANERHVMTMQDWLDATDDLLKFRRKDILKHSGNFSHKQAVKKRKVNMKNIGLSKVKSIFLQWINFIINI